MAYQMLWPPRDNFEKFNEDLEERMIDLIHMDLLSLLVLI